MKGDFIEAAKVIRDFAKDNKALVIKGAAADGTVYDAEGAKKLGKHQAACSCLPRFAGDIKASMASAGAPVQRPAYQGCAHDRRPARKAGCLIYALTA